MLALLTPLATVFACVLAAGRPRLQLFLSWTGLSVLLVCAVALLLQVENGGTLRVALGNWPACFGIEFAADRLGASMVLVAAPMGAAALVFQMSDADPASPDGALYPLMHGLLAGACGAFLTADLFNLYVWFELTLICALGLMVRGAALRDLEATLKCFALYVAGTLLLLVPLPATGAAGEQRTRDALCPSGMLMVAAIGLHSIPEGLAVGASHVGGAASGASTRMGLRVALGTGLRPVPGLPAQAASTRPVQR